MSIQQNFVAIKPSLNLDFANTKQLDPRITFARASTARFYDGKTTALAEQNLLTFSEQFDNGAWTVGGTTVTANATTAPDGTTTADKLVSSATTGEQRIYRGAGVSTVTGQVYTYSVYAKSDTVPFVIFRDDFGGYGDTSFNISAGTVGTVASGKTATITSVGNGWYRCSVTATSSSATQQLMFCLASTDNGRTSFSGNGTSGVLLWGAQLEQRSFATAYTPTTTQPITNYIPVLQTAAAGTPRFDHNPVTGESLGLLIEEQRTNLLVRSDDYANTTWVKASATIDSNTVVAPDGTLTGDKLVEDTTNGVHYASQGATVANVSNSFSVYLKAAGRNFAAIECTGQFVYFDLVNGTVGLQTNATGSIQSVGNGWFRCTMIFTPIAGGRSFIVYPSTTATTGGVNYTGNGFSGIYIWGAQMEAGSFATSYIPTVASQVTRAADSASITGSNFSSWFNPSEGTFFFNATTASVANRGMFFATNGTSSQSFFTYGSGNSFVFSGNYNGASQFAIAQNFNTLSNLSALGYKVNDFAATSNGAVVTTDNAGSIPLGINQIQIGYLTNSNDQNINGTIKKIAYYPIRCTNTQLQALTS